MLKPPFAYEALLGLVKEGKITAGNFAINLIKNYIQQILNFIFDTISNTLPNAFMVAGAILLVCLGWRLFRNLTHG